MKKKKIEQIRSSKKQVFLLHFAGGNCYSFDFLKSQMSKDVEFIPLELPGRGRRFNEELLKTKKAAIQDYFAQIKKLRNDQSYVIYGHSMGSNLGLNVTKLLEDFGDPPNYLIVSGNPGPGVKTKEIGEVEKKGKRYRMSDEDFKEELRKLGGVPKEILENEELYNFFSPIMRTDFEILEKDNFSEKGLMIETPIYALMGDEERTFLEIENWSNFTNANLRHEILSGNHFFINKHPNKLADVILECSKISSIISN